MEKRILNHQSGTVIVDCPETKEFFLGQYDPGYPGNPRWIGRVKLLGGNYFYGRDNDQSPQETLIREINEEFSAEQPAEGEMAAKVESFASKQDIDYIRSNLIKACPFMDYLLHQPSIKEGKPDIYVIQSVFQVTVPREFMECVKENNAKGKNLINEGMVVVKTLDDLARGNPMAQGATGLIISHQQGVFFPHDVYEAFTFAPMGKPHSSYQDYLPDFEYRDHTKKS